MDTIILAGLVVAVISVIYFRYKNYQKSGKKSDLYGGLITQLLSIILISLSPSVSAVTANALSKRRRKKTNILLTLLFFLILGIIYYIFLLK